MRAILETNYLHGIGVPDFDGAVIRRCGEHAVVEGIPVHSRYASLVPVVVAK